MTDLQKVTVASLLTHVTHGHHGDCIGADAQFHQLATSLGIKVIVHPPRKQAKRAFCTGAWQVREEKEYLARNHDIVAECHLLIATPKEVIEPTHTRAGGTWWTIRHARSLNKPVIIVWPLGEQTT